MAERFFRATALAGELHLIDFHDGDDWKLEDVQYRDEAEVRRLMRTGAGERRIIRTVPELDAVIDESASKAIHRSMARRRLAPMPRVPRLKEDIRGDRL